MYDSSTDKSFCKVRIVDCSSAAATSSVESPSTSTKLCGHAIAKKYPTNLRTHLKNSHLLEYKELLKKDERQKAETAEAEKAMVKKSMGPIRTQMTLGEAFTRKYDKTRSNADRKRDQQSAVGFEAESARIPF